MFMVADSSATMFELTNGVSHWAHLQNEFGLKQSAQFLEVAVITKMLLRSSAGMPCNGCSPDRLPHLPPPALH